MILEGIAQPGHLTTRSCTRLANFCENFSFVSMLEPSKFDEAMMDPDWLIAIHEELHCLRETKFGPSARDLILRSITSLERSGSSAINKMKMVSW